MEKNSYERRVYEPVDNRALSSIIFQKSTNNRIAFDKLARTLEYWPVYLKIYTYLH